MRHSGDVGKIGILKSPFMIQKLLIPNALQQFSSLVYDSPVDEVMLT